MVLTAVQASVRARVAASARREFNRGLFHLTFHAMNTVCRVVCASTDRQAVAQYQDAVLQWVADFEARYSRFIDDSIIGRINAAAGLHWVEIDPETERLLQFCGQMVALTRGSFDPTSLPLLRLWNWKAKPPVIPSESDCRAALELTGWSKLQRRPGAVFLPKAGMGLDLGGVGKEYAVDCVLQFGMQRGLTDILVDFGQDVRAHGRPPDKPAWHIGLEDPDQPGRCWAGIGVTNLAVATSGDYLRHFTVDGKRFGHILDPRTGRPVDNGCRAVTVIAPSCTQAGILSTSVFILGPREGLELVQLCPNVEACIITEQGRHTTPNFYAYVST